MPPPEPGSELLLTDALRTAGARLVERDGAMVVAWLPVPPGSAAEALVREVEGAVRALDPEGPVRWRWATADELADRWSRDLAPRQVTPRIRVVPQATTGPAPSLSPPADGVVVRLLPGGAFGTAEHPTTRVCLAFLERLVAPGARVLEVGAGSGILAIAAALLGARRVLALEADGVACHEARANADLNGVAARVRVRQRRVTARTLRWRRRVPLVVANLPPADLFPLLPHLGAALRRGGRALVSGVPRSERAAAVALLAEGGLVVEEEVVEEGWWTAAARRQSMRPTARAHRSQS
ncbi:MAG TPA: 50S ribosomal protein L11 methyltransferase [Longimicrobiales bacterium]|nr:50S ribosomal protein L11 methyltransferase [Longimicrobiales bacterium]